MNLYDVKCEVHGHQEIRASSKDAVEGALRCQADVNGAQCGMSVTRIYGVPQEISDNEWSPRYSEQLSDTPGQPVYVKSRSHQKELMAAKGLAHWEPGMKPPPTRSQTSEQRRFERKQTFLKKWREANTIDLG